MMKSRLSNMDYKSLVSRGDLHYHKAVKRSEGGIPIGNGRMGSLVWTSPSAIKFQVNRIDVYANDCTTKSFNQRDLDYAYGCGFIDIDFVDYGEDVFIDNAIKQHLSIYDAIALLNGKDIDTEIFAYDNSDVFGIRVDDKREYPQTINIKLKMLRPSEVVTKHHSAISTLSMDDECIILKQEFREGDYYCSSAIAIGIYGRNAIARMNDELGGREPICDFRQNLVLGQPNETEMRLCIKPERGKFDIFIASAASFDEKEDVVALAISQVNEAKNIGYDKLIEEHRKWWHQFWEKSYIHLSSEDGTAEFVEAHYSYFLYIMASSSRGGKYPPNFGGMLWSTRGDFRHWGAQQWWNNLNLYYRAIMPSGHMEIMHPLFNMYTGMYDSCAKAAEQQWGSKGIFIPEIVWFNGLEELPEDIVQEMRDLYLLRKPWEERSERFNEYAFSQHPHSNTWNWKAKGTWKDGKWVYTDKGYGVFGHVTHMFGSQGRIAYLYWLYYEYTKDICWLRERAYPMIRGVAEFFRNYPNIKKDQDGKYHIYHVSHDEGYHGCKDGMEAIAAIHGIFPVLLKASDILDIDEEMRPLWREFYENIAPMPTSDNLEAVLRTQDGQPPVWVGALKPIRDNRSFTSVAPCVNYDLCSLETAHGNANIFDIGMNTIKYIIDRYGIDSRQTVHEMSDFAQALANMGFAEGFKQVIIAQLQSKNAEAEYCYFSETKQPGAFENRMTLREGVNTLGGQRLGNAAVALQYALCRSHPGTPGEESIIHLFAAWPKGWDAEFSLWCWGGFRVTSSIKGGEINLVEINSTLGGRCRLRNPWGPKEVKISIDGGMQGKMNGLILEIDTSKGDNITIELSE